MLRIFWSFRTPDSKVFLVEHVSILLLKLCRQILCIYHVTESLTLYQEFELERSELRGCVVNECSGSGASLGVKGFAQPSRIKG